ncbi:MAG: glycosyltransferase [Clostridia bacterium]|nr:glycosyltransferase [Clostridia bacterium]
MNENEYLKKIEDIRSQITKNPKGALEIINEMYKFKPVRQQWFIAKAEAMLQLGASYEDILGVLSGKFDASISEQTRDSFSVVARAAKNGSEKSRRMFLVDLYDFVMHPTEECEKRLSEHYAALARARERFMEDVSPENIKELAELYYITDNQYIYVLLRLMLESMCGEDANIENETKTTSNVGYLIEVVSMGDSDSFIIIEDDDYLDCKVAAIALSRLGKKVYWVRKPVNCPASENVNIKDTLAVSLDNIESGEYTSIYPVRLIRDGQSMGDNREYIISHITEHFSNDNFATVLCSGNLFDELAERPLIQKRFQRLSYFKSDCLNTKLEFGWTGDYLAYISRIYGFDVRDELNKPAECDFSIVVPARNSSASLKHTLRTCLNQRFCGKYEIVLSDNSSEGNMQVYDLYREIGDKRIKYYKTPRELSLPKSFEFAFLKAKGNFIFSIGSDDGVLPWALDVLSDKLKEIPNDEILMWERGFYAWPGFNGGQQHQFIIPRAYQRKKVNIERMERKNILAQVLIDPNFMYGLPMLYINSGFRRSYFKTLLNKTGRLWDGVCQDIYIGIINISINKDFPFIKHPITIAGMTNSSVGLTSNEKSADDKEVNIKIAQRNKTDNVGGYALTPLERLIPPYETDRVSLYRSIMRAIALGLLPKNLLSSIDWKKIFSFIAAQLSVDDVQIDLKLKLLKNCAKSISEEVFRFVDGELYSNMTVPRETAKITNNAKLYEEGFTPDGGIVLDASKFGVNNIFEAAELFEKLTGL